MADAELKEMQGQEAIAEKGISGLRDDADSGLDNTSDSGQSEEESKESFSSDSDDSDHSAPRPPKRKTKTTENCHIFLVNDETARCPFRVGVPDGNSQPLCQIIDDKTLQEIKIDGLTQADEIAVLEIDEPLIVNIGQSEKNHFYSLDEETKKIYSERIPEFTYFEKLSTKAQLETIDFGVSLDDRPEWLDEEKYKRGQRFAQKYLFCLNFAEMLSLLMLFAFKAAVAPLIFTGRSSTPYKAFQRYLSTFLRLKSWYEGDIWNDKSHPARKNMSVVKALHKSVYHKMTETPSEEMKEKTTLGDERTTAVWCTLKDTVREDFQSSCPMGLPGTNPYENGRQVWANQLDMAITQFGFVGLAVTYPKQFGIHGATDEDMDAFLHMWRGLGFLLGVKDEYNFCNADLNTVRERTKCFIDIAVRPALREVDSDWEHMCRCLIQGIGFYVKGVTFEVSLQFLTDVLKIHTPRLKKSFTFLHKILYAISKFVFRYFFRVPGVLSWNTSLLKKSIKMAQEASPEKLSEWEKKQFKYMKQADKKQVL